MTGNFKFKTLYNINNPTAEKWYVRERNIKESPYEATDKNTKKRKFLNEFFGLLSASNVENAIMGNGFMDENVLFETLTKEQPCLKGCGSCELPTDRMRNMNIKEYIMLGLFLKRHKAKYNKKKDLFITKNKK